MSYYMEELEKYLQSHIDNSIKSVADLPAATEIPNMDKAYKRLMQALSNNERIFFVHDSDADGVGSASLAYQFMNELGVDKNQRIHRITKRDEGYGFIPEHVDEALAFGTKLIITTDNGISSFDAVNYAAEKGVDVIITDHHQVDYNYGIPEKAIVINPQIIEDDHVLKDISGTAVFWYLIKYISEVSPLNINPWQYYEELALTTISDVMPLRHVNRFWVKNGLEYYNEKVRKPFAKIIKDNNRYDPKVKAETLAFSYVPPINAANRFGQAEHAFHFLISETEKDANAWYTLLTQLNSQRKELTHAYTEIAKSNPILYGHLVFVILNDAEKGVLGVLANKLAQLYNRPAIVVTTVEDGVVKGSGRSVGRINMLEILKKSGLCTAGGHKQAFGVEIEKDNISPLIQFINNELINLPKNAYVEPDEAILELPFSEINQEIYDTIDKYEPYGHGCPKPIFGVNAEVVKKYTFGAQSNHVKYIFKDEFGNETEMVNFFDNEKDVRIGSKVRLNYTITYDLYRNMPVGRIHKFIK